MKLSVWRLLPFSSVEMFPSAFVLKRPQSISFPWKEESSLKLLPNSWRINSLYSEADNRSASESILYRVYKKSPPVPALSKVHPVRALSHSTSSKTRVDILYSLCYTHSRKSCKWSLYSQLVCTILIFLVNKSKLKCLCVSVHKYILKLITWR
jgi:hypothetical protein